MEIHIGDRIADITLVGKEGNKVQLTIDGKPYEVDIVMAENGSCSILHNGNSFNAGLVRGEGGKSYDISMLQRSFHVDIVDTQAKYLHMKKGADEKQGDKILAPMPGTVVSIPVKVGDRLAAGDSAVVMEAMKMQREKMMPLGVFTPFVARSMASSACRPIRRSTENISAASLWT